MTMGWPRRFERVSAAARAMRSLAPPGPNGTTHLIAWSGQSARATPEASSAGAMTIAAIIAKTCRREPMRLLRLRAFERVGELRHEREILRRAKRRGLGRDSEAGLR